MDETLLREIATDYLVPFFSGAELRTDSTKSRSSRRVVLQDPESIAFKVDKADSYRMVLTRPQAFAQETSAAVPEIAIVRAFVNVISRMASQLTTSLKHDLLSTFQRRIVARALGFVEEPTDVSTGRERTLLSGIDLLAGWANRLYEGSHIAASIGFRHTPQGSDAIPLGEFGKNDFGAVVSNGHDTLLEFDFGGRFIRHACLRPGSPVPSFCPFRQSPVAEWTKRDEKRRRVAFALNRLGEILAFRDEQLLFARRSDRWNFLTHEPVLTQMGTPQDTDIRRAVYETCLDASFARTGACIGVVSSSNRARWLTVVVDTKDHLGARESVKARAINAMVRAHRFHKIDRRLRQELVAIDGATVLSHEGDLLAVGSILKIPGGSTGGGRLAAAKALGELGLGIKVSQDGGITCFRPGKSEPAFRLM